MSLFCCAELIKQLSGKCLPGVPGSEAVDSLRGACVNWSVATLRRNCPGGVQLSRKFTVISIIPDHLTTYRVENPSKKTDKRQNECPMVEPMPENYDLSDRKSPGIEKKILRRSGSPYPCCPVTSFPSPYILNYPQINPRFLICIRLITHGRCECQEVIDARDWILDAG